MSKELVFKFSDGDLKRLIISDLNLNRRMRKSFDYVYDKLKDLGHYLKPESYVIPDNEDYIESGLFKKGKSYHWSAIDYDTVRILIRKYSNHLTIFSRLEIEKDGYKDIDYACFELYTDTSIEYELNQQGKSDIENYHGDFFWCNPFYDYNLLIKDIVEHIREGHVWLLDNNASIPRPKRVKLKPFYHGEESIDSIDKMVFAAEELAHIHMVLFAENDMVEKLKTLKVGDEIAGKKIVKIKTSLKDKYDNYHSVGLTWVERGDKEKWNDVYSLTHWHVNEIFNFVPDEYSNHEKHVIGNHMVKIARRMYKEEGKTYEEIEKFMEDCPDSMSKFFLLNSIKR